jgi:hypothetical protein
MKKLERSQLKVLMGGVAAPPPMIISSDVTGTRLYNGQCYCDQHVIWSNGTYANICDVKCGMFWCTDPSWGHAVPL